MEILCHLISGVTYRSVLPTHFILFGEQQTSVFKLANDLV